MKPTKRPNSASSPEPPARDALIDALADLSRERPTVTGLSTQDIMAATGWSMTMTKAVLRRAFLAGQLETARDYRPAIDGFLRMVPVYRVRGKAA